ncbi:hypothetical protein FRB95_002850 [Tulasnella sp. JGI-2019a]|nr:hypothetical protein FRB95_002850 [Tulasnella sp. JGI-2019a]
MIQKQQEADIDQLIELLGNVDPGMAKKPPCMDGTRIDLLERIRRWIERPSERSRTCFTLTGAAGSGKSSIAASIADQQRKLHQLGGRFHFTRDEPARNNGAILALARQLASWQAGRLRPEIASAIEEERDMAHMTPDYQFRKLIQEPLESLDITSPVLVIVLDALGEWDPKYAASLLSLIIKGLPKLPSTTKFFITSRAEPHLQYHYERDPTKSRVESCSLEDESLESVEKDIETYFREELPEMVGPLLKEFISDWPGEDRRGALTRKSQGLFIYATTAARMLADPNVGRDPERQLEKLLSSEDSAPLDDIYDQVLDRACPRTIGNDIHALFRSVLGALVVAQEPVNTYTLASLLCSDRSQQREFTDTCVLRC